MVRIITQETYDEIVKENMEEFDMSPEEAVKEAIAQFEAQGVDLSNVIKDLALSNGDDHLVSTTILKLKGLCGTNERDEENIIKELQIFKSECNKDIAHRVRAGKEGAYPVLVNLLDTKIKSTENISRKDEEFLVSVLESLVALMDMQPDLLDDKAIDFIERTLNNVNNENVLATTLRWASISCVKHEMNRQKLFARHIGKSLKKILYTKNSKMLSEALQLIRKMTLDDDIRHEFGKAHEHARDMGVLLLEPLTALLKENTKPPLVSELMLTMATLLVRYELCKMVEDCGVDVLFTVLADNYDNGAVIQQAHKLITALAGNDDVKRALVKSGITPIIISLMSRHSNNETTSALILKCVAALTLREPAHSKEFLENGAPEAIVECLKRHPDSASVQKNGCWALRNMVARCRDHNTKFHELGVQAILNAAHDRFAKDFGFDIRSALRDLECDVKFDEQWTGTGAHLEQ